MKQTKKSSTLDREIDENLKRAFDAVLNEEVPDRFNTLLERLRKTGSHQAPDGTPNGQPAGAPDKKETPDE